MGIWDYFRRGAKTPAADQPADPLAIQSWHEGNCRYVEWSTRESSWDECAGLVDRFLAAAVQAATTAGKSQPQWLVLTYEPRPGALTLVPVSDASREVEDWPVHFTLKSQFLKSEAQRALADTDARAIREHAARMWKIVSRSLTKGEAAKRLTEARLQTPLRVAGYDYDEAHNRGGSRLNENGELM